MICRTLQKYKLRRKKHHLAHGVVHKSRDFKTPPTNNNNNYNNKLPLKCILSHFRPCFFSTFRGAAPNNNERTKSVPTRKRSKKKDFCVQPLIQREFSRRYRHSFPPIVCSPGLWLWLWWTLHKGTADADKIFSTLIPTTVRFMIFSPSCDPTNHTSTYIVQYSTNRTQYSTVSVR